MKHVSFILCLMFVATINAQIDVAEPNAFARSTQMIVVTTTDWNAVEGQLQRYERATPHDRWLPIGDPVSIVVGKNGLGWGIGLLATEAPEVRLADDPVKKEGDGKAPAGVFALGTAFGYASQPLPGVKLPYQSLTSSIECVDDVASKYYNRVVDRSSVAPDWNSSERMRSVGDSYHWGIVVDHNRAVRGTNANSPTPGGGSCIFLHIWHGAALGTVGCTAMPQLDLEALLIWLDPARKPLLVQLPAAEYRRLIGRWSLPPLTNVPSR
jgi:hypothetical protein